MLNTSGVKYDGYLLSQQVVPRAQREHFGSLGRKRPTVTLQQNGLAERSGGVTITQAHAIRTGARTPRESRVILELQRQ